MWSITPPFFQLCHSPPLFYPWKCSEQRQVSPHVTQNKVLSPPAETPGLSQVPFLVQRLQDSLHTLSPNLKQRLFSHRSSSHSRLFTLGPNKQSLSGDHKTAAKPVNSAEAHLKYMMHAMFSGSIGKEKFLPLLKSQMHSIQSGLETCHSKQGSDSPTHSSSTLPPASCKLLNSSSLRLIPKKKKKKSVTALGLS